MMSEAFCLALAIYFEARSEPLHGQVAVAQVIMRRVDSPRFKPTTICGVVTQPSQFSFYWDGVPDLPLEVKAWEEAQLLASAVLSKDSIIYDYSEGADHYAVEGVQRVWMNGMVSHQIGEHVFYKGES